MVCGHATAQGMECRRCSVDTVIYLEPQVSAEYQYVLKAVMLLYLHPLNYSYHNWHILAETSFEGGTWSGGSVDGYAIIRKMLDSLLK
jgi:hypothetical protein